ncbi:MAG: TerB family tellurite resistance protein [Myxococcota bacterium]
MSTLHDWIRFFDDPQGAPPTLTERDPLGTLLVHLAYADGLVQGDELAFFERLLPRDSDAARWVSSQATRPVDLDALAPLMATPDDRRALLAVAARVVGLDGAIATEEVIALHRIADHFGFDRSAIRVALDEVIGAGGAIDASAVEHAVNTMVWRHLVVRKATEPDALVVLGRPEHDAADVIVRTDGLWARFDEGPATIPFADIVAYTRLPVRGRAFHLRTDGSDHSLVHPSFRDLGCLLDRIYGRSAA